MSDSAAGKGAWKLSLPCTRDEAEAIALADLDLPAVLMTSEVDEATSEWRLDAYFEGEPAHATVAAIRELAASGGWSRAQPAPLPDQDWVTLSQAGLEPIREGRFVVHTGAHRPEAAPGIRSFLVEAGQAFGTGHHHTTAGCLAMLDDLAGETFDTIIDLGTGTGLLAFAARHLWPEARVVATDIDPIAIAVTRENAVANGVCSIDLVVADGARDAAIADGAPYDLVIANILAGPLIAMAPEIAAIAAPGATIVLAGLLDSQREGVVAAYAACGGTLAAVDRRGDWSILRLVAGAAVPNDGVAAGDRTAWATDT